MPYFTVFLQPQIYLDASFQQTDRKHHRTVEEPYHPNTVSVNDLVDEDDYIQGREATKNRSEQMGNVHLNRWIGLSNSNVQIYTSDCNRDSKEGKY